MLRRAAWVALVLTVPALAEVRLGVYGSFTGDSAGAGISMRNGVDLAADEINAAGGVLGQRITLVKRDDEGKAERGAQILEELLGEGRVAAVLGPTRSVVAAASLRLASERKVPLIVNVATGAEVDGPESYAFRLAASDALQADLVVEEAIDVRKYKKPALLCDDSEEGQAARSRLEEALGRRKVNAVQVGKFKSEDTDMAAQLREARAAGASVLLVSGSGRSLAEVATSLERVGWKVDLLGGWTLGTSAFIEQAGRNGEGATSPQTFIEGEARGAVQRKFVERYRKRFEDHPMQAAAAAAQGYDSLYLLKQAIEQARSTDGSRVRQALESLKKPFVGVTGTYRTPFSATHHEAVTAEQVTMGVVKAGRVVPSARK